MLIELIFLSTEYAMRHHITDITAIHATQMSRFTVFVLFNITLVDEFWISDWALLYFSNDRNVLRTV